VVYLKPKQLIIKDFARRFVLKLYRHEASRGLFATAELLVFTASRGNNLSEVHALFEAVCTVENKTFSVLGERQMSIVFFSVLSAAGSTLTVQL